jgi:two-component system OmpR family sensor kinase
MKFVFKSIRGRLQFWHGLLLFLLLGSLSARFYFVARESHSSVHLVIALGVVLTLGLLSGWWLSSRVVRPIKEISDSAKKIASGNLAERINVTKTDSELDQLAGVLNTCFDQVQASFNRLQAALDRQVQFTADASHELRTPVSVILAEANLALARERTPAEYQAALESCREAARRMRRLIESLLILARLDSDEGTSNCEHYDLRAVTLEAVKLLSPLAGERGIKIRTKLGAAVCVGDAEQLGQVVTNLVSNAIHYNRPGGEVCVSLVSDGGPAVLTISDTGQGIAAGDLSHIFERFYRADKPRAHANGRVGLGLAITKTLVERNSGTVHVSSEVGKGSTFSVRLPSRHLSE